MKRFLLSLALICAAVTARAGSVGISDLMSIANNSDLLLILQDKNTLKFFDENKIIHFVRLEQFMGAPCGPNSPAWYHMVLERKGKNSELETCVVDAFAGPNKDECGSPERVGSIGKELVCGAEAEAILNPPPDEDSW